jgi:hypothetical protein
MFGKSVSERTFAGARGNDKDTPQSVIRSAAGIRRSST